MPLRHLQHALFKSQVQTPSSSLKSTIDHQCVQEPDYFDSVEKLQSWAATNASSKFEPILGDDEKWATKSICQTQTDAYAAHPIEGSSGKPKLIVCHDFKGGYTENPFEQDYSFEFWHLVDTFIYFSHNRVTIPPRGWLDAGRRHGTKVLGTVIFEWKESKPDLQKCLYGEKLDAVQHTTLPAADTSHQMFSTQYALYLITLAQVRKIDGYLLNIETDLNFLPPVSSYPGKTQVEQDEDAEFLERESSLSGLSVYISEVIKSRRKQRMLKNANALLGWVQWLREEGKMRIGPHWEVIWYDSVTINGELEWQDALTPDNAAFFMNSDAIFTNYTWARPPDPSLPGALPEAPSCGHHPALLTCVTMADSLNRSKGDIYVGIDVFGRNCYGGFAVGLSLKMIFASHNSSARGRSDGSQLFSGKDLGENGLGLSVALFAPGWTWEREKEGSGERTWSEWWEDEQQFWFGCKTNGMGVCPGEPGPGAVGAFFGPRERSLIRTASTLDISQRLGQPLDTSTHLQNNSSVSPVGGQALCLPFYTNFNRGSGKSWWVHGYRVYDALHSDKKLATRHGWTDMGTCFPKPDRIWPQATLLYSKGGDKRGSTALMPLSCNDVVLNAALIDHDVWEGGTSLEIELKFADLDLSCALGVDFSCTVLPLCTLHKRHASISDPGPCIVEIIIKCLSVSADIWPCILWSDSKPTGRESYYTSQVPSRLTQVRKLANGWCSIAVLAQFDCASNSHLPMEVAPVVALEVCHPLLDSKTQDATYSDMKLIVGAISLVPRASPPLTESSRLHNGVSTFPVVDSELANASQKTSPGVLLWKPISLPMNAPTGTLWGILTWSEPFEIDAARTTSYYNVFASQRSPEEMQTDIDYSDYLWLGTSTYESDSNTFVVAGLALQDVPARSWGFDIQDMASSHRTTHDSSLPLGRVHFLVERIGVVEGLLMNESPARFACRVEY